MTNKVSFAPEKLKIIHITKKPGSYALACVVNDDLIIHPTIAA